MCGHRSCSNKPHIVPLMEYLCLFPLTFFCWRCWPGGWAGSSWSKRETCQRDSQLSICPKFLFQYWSIFPTSCINHSGNLVSWNFFLSHTFANIKIQVYFFLLVLYSCCLQRRWGGFSGVFYRISEIHYLFSDNGYLKFFCFSLCRLEPCKKPGRAIIQHADQGWDMHALPDWQELWASVLLENRRWFELI